MHHIKWSKLFTAYKFLHLIFVLKTSGTNRKISGFFGILTPFSFTESKIKSQLLQFYSLDNGLKTHEISKRYNTFNSIELFWISPSVYRTLTTLIFGICIIQNFITKVPDIQKYLTQFLHILLTGYILLLSIIHTTCSYKSKLLQRKCCAEQNNVEQVLNH